MLTACNRFHHEGMGWEHDDESKRRVYMNDLIFVGTIIAFFVIGGLYVHLCGKL